MSEISRQLINEAAGKLQDIGATQEANEVIQLLAKYESTRRRPWLQEDILDQMVRILYPPNDDWTDELKERHFRYLKLALSIDQDALNEDVKQILKQVEAL